MTKDIKDFLPLYLGQECLIGDANWERPKIGASDISPNVDLNYGKPIRTTLDLHSIQHFSHKIKLLLRPLSSITEEDGKYIFEDWDSDILSSRDIILNNKASELTFKVSEINKGRERGYDFDDLIPEGLALDTTTLKK